MLTRAMSNCTLLAQENAIATPSIVANRVSEIQESTSDMTWRHIRRHLNPGDLISRGLLPADIIDNKLWWHAADFLLLPENQWPTLIVKINLTEPLYTSEFKKIDTLALSSHEVFQEPNIFSKWIEKSGRSISIKPKLAPTMRFIFNLRARKITIPRQSGQIQVADLIGAEIALIASSKRHTSVLNLKICRIASQLHKI